MRTKKRENPSFSDLLKCNLFLSHSLPTSQAKLQTCPSWKDDIKAHLRNKSSQKCVARSLLGSEQFVTGQGTVRNAPSGTPRDAWLAPEWSSRAQSVWRNCPERLGVQRAKESSMSRVLGVPSIKPEKLTSTMNCVCVKAVLQPATEDTVQRLKAK